MKDTDFRFSPRVLRRIRGCVADGMNGRQIAQRLGCDYDSLRTICGRHGISLRCDPAVIEEAKTLPPIFALRRSGTRHVIEVPVGRLVAETYRREALLRGVSINALMGRIIELVATDQLIPAVIDEKADAQ